MSFTLNNSIRINALSLKPEIIVWCARIPEILQSICNKRSKCSYHSSGPQVNEIFQKNDFTPAFLSSDEIEVLNGFKALKKQVEWICGRFIVKSLLRKVFLKALPLDRITLDYHEQGAPFVTAAPDTAFSLSHSNAYTVVACASDPNRILGIDIEKIAKKPDIHFLKTAFTAYEISRLQDDAAAIFKNWTIKEAYLKYIKKGFNENLHRVEVVDNHIFHHGRKTDLEISSVFFKGYVISLVCDR